MHLYSCSNAMAAKWNFQDTGRHSAFVTAC